jgi:hypothetical protein
MMMETWRTRTENEKAAKNSGQIATRNETTKDAYESMRAQY